MKRVKHKKNSLKNVSILIWSFMLISCNLIVLSVAAQKYNIRFQCVDQPGISIIDSLNKNTFYQQKETAFEAINQSLLKIKGDGFLAASVDSFQEKENEINAFVYLGKRYSFCQVDFSGIPINVMQQLGLKSANYNKSFLSLQAINTLTNKMLTWYEQEGFPFAQVSTILKEDTLGWRLHFEIDPRIQIYFDSIIINTDDKIPEQFITQLLGIKKGQLYDERKVKSIDSKMNGISFLEQKAPWKLEFKGNKAQLILSLNEKKVNQLNALIGLMPNANQTNKMLITGDVFLLLQNALNFGESLMLNYQNLQFQSPRLKFEGMLPYLFSSPLGLETNFEFFRKDSSFRRINFRIGLNYSLNANESIKFFGQINDSRLITADTQSIKQTKTLLDADVSSKGIGLSYLWNNLDYRMNPKRGWDVVFTSTISQRDVIANPLITNLKDTAIFDFSNLYKGQNSAKQIFQISGKINTYFTLKREFVLQMGYQFGWQNNQQLFRNELFQIGGFKTFRGFDEQSIFTSEFHVLSIDLRLITNKNSNIYLFSDNGMIKQPSLKYRWQTGVGIGANVETKQGILSISYALGFAGNSSFDFRQSKIHFGYVAVF